MHSVVQKLFYCKGISRGGGACKTRAHIDAHRLDLCDPAKHSPPSYIKARNQAVSTY